MKTVFEQLFFAAIIGLISAVYPACSAVFAGEKNYTIATGSDIITDLSHLDRIYDVIPILQESAPGDQQHGHINIEGNGAFGGLVGAGTDTPAAALHVIGTTSVFMCDVGIRTETPGTTLEVVGTITATGFVGEGSGLSGVGNGYSLDADDGTPSSAVYVNYKGEVGIGTTTPAATLHITHSTSGTATTHPDSVLALESNTTNVLSFLSPNNVSTAGIYFADPENFEVGKIVYNHTTNKMTFVTNNSQNMVITSSGDIGIGNTAPAVKLDVEGTIEYDGLQQESDIRSKKDVNLLSDSLDRLTQLQGVSYRFKEEARDKGVHLGLIAQETEVVYPEVVKTKDDGYKSIAYTELIAPIIEALKELRSENEDLKNTVTTLANELTNVKIGLRDAAPYGDKLVKLDIFTTTGQ